MFLRAHDFWYNPGPPAQGGTAHNDLALPHLLLIKEMLYKLQTYGQADGGIVSTEVLSTWLLPVLSWPTNN